VRILTDTRHPRISSATWTFTGAGTRRASNRPADGHENVRSGGEDASAEAAIQAPPARLSHPRRRCWSNREAP